MFGYKRRKDLQFLCQAVESPAPGVQLPRGLQKAGQCFYTIAKSISQHSA
jgi:hypothetical protein